MNSCRLPISSPISQVSQQSNQSHNSLRKNSRRPKLVDGDTLLHSGVWQDQRSRRGQTSITHLMNITLSPLSHEQGSSRPRGLRKSNNYGISSSHRSSDKARYIHANFRFIVNPQNEYKSQVIDSDQPLDWNCILQLLASPILQEISCPICLSHPAAPRMAKCGHIFCLPCLIHYMHSTDVVKSNFEKKAHYKQCPICNDSMSILETKPVRWYIGQEVSQLHEGDEIILRLMTRYPHSTLALPKDSAETAAKHNDIPWYFEMDVLDHARVMKGTEDYMIEQHNTEIEILLLREKEDSLIFGEDSEWTQKAISAIKKDKENVHGLGNPSSSFRKQNYDENKKKLKNTSTNNSDNSSAEFDNRKYEDYPSNANCDEKNKIRTQTEKKNKHHDLAHQKIVQDERRHLETPYYFYQTLPNYFLAPLDIRILKTAYGTFESFPSILLSRIENIATGYNVDTDLKKRKKYLSHLPIGCDISFIECDWTSFICPEILKQFEEEIRSRRKRNHEKTTREDQDRLRAEEFNEISQWGVNPAAPYGDELAELHQQNFQAMKDSSIDKLEALHDLPSIGSSKVKTVWGTSLAAPTSLQISSPEPQEDSDDGWLNPWQNERLANHLNTTTENLSQTEDNYGNNSTAGTCQSKKKKTKKILLMSTTPRRAA
ncbi:BgTH12-03524 [Blumeria graminis f. sp. triticale]|uniref:Bgt-4482 n=3 Tax=Blumeria graminis TaxID=34373 RepID=A0A9X9L888_BLUGR|nr:BgTH12-03524 [Blumeria graminis f. sp. triticale]VCU39561.1 Bgt-4482 [Blumeria graminis f. sp. tritici]